MTAKTTDLDFLNAYDLTPLNLPDMPRFIDLVTDIVTGQIDLSPSGIFSRLGEIIFREIFANGLLIRQLLVVAIIGALLSVLTQAFTHKGAGEVGLYVTFLMGAGVAVSSYYIAVEIFTGLMGVINVVMLASVPIMAGLMAMGGNFVGGAWVHGGLFVMLQLLSAFISHVFVPLVLGAAGLDIVSKMFSDGAKLTMLSGLVAKIADWGLKGILGAIGFLLTLQRFAAPVASNLAIGTTRNIVGAVPVVGGAFTAAVDTIQGFSQAGRSGVLVALVLVLVWVVAGPLAKIFMIGLVYKFVAAFLQPVADPRLVAIVASVGKHLSMIFFAGALVGLVCIYGVIVLLSF